MPSLMDSDLNVISEGEAVNARREGLCVEEESLLYQEHRARSSSWPGASWLGVIIRWDIRTVICRVLY